MGIMVIDSTPPATTTSAPPAMMRSAPWAIACKPDEQKRLMVMAETSTGQAGAQGGDAGDVHALFGFGHGAAEDDVLNFLGIELGHALKRALDREGGEVIGTGGAQGSFVGFADRGTDGTDDYYFTHEKAPKLVTGNW